MKALTLHILDTAQGESANGIAFEIDCAVDGVWHQVASGITAENGRFEPHVLADDRFPHGSYRLRLMVGDYFAREGVLQGNPRFFDIVDINFQVGNEGVHLPVLITPWSYSVYRGC
jgi:5-hydroxyisourate hydrolase